MGDKMNWMHVNEDYLIYLRENIEKRIPYSDYGSNKFKPFFGELFRRGSLIYVTQVSSPKERHYAFKESLDFKKIYDPDDRKKLLCVINLNYMFPVPEEERITVAYSQIEQFRTFESFEQKDKYISCKLLLTK
jgi:protein AbiQ